jgi:hypothetical protein
MGGSMLALEHRGAGNMRKVGTFIAIAAFTGIAFVPPPAAAFGLRFGPFSIHVPLYIPRFHPPLYMHANPNDLAQPEAGPNLNSALLYPNQALPAIFQAIFFPADAAPWPYGYEAIFSTAFAQARASGDQRFCQPAVDPDAIVGRIRNKVAPTADQMQSLQKLGGALGAAGGYLAKACPDEIPQQPVARVQLMESQIEELAMAIDIVRQPLQDFEVTLTPDQRAKLAPPAAAAAAPSAPAAAQPSDPDTTGTTAKTAITIAPACAGSSTAIDATIDQIDKTVRPTDAQQPALSDVRDAFAKAVGDLQAHCPSSVAATAVGRLEAIEARLDATWRSELSIQVALANFESKLTDDQKKSFDTMNLAAAQ